MLGANVFQLARASLKVKQKSKIGLIRCAFPPQRLSARIQCTPLRHHRCRRTAELARCRGRSTEPLLGRLRLRSANTWSQYYSIL